MTITNVLNLPAPLVAAIRADPYGSGGADISVTTLCKPPRMVALEVQHRAQLVEDASERLWALLGRLGHAILAAAANNEIVHKRLFTSCLNWTVSGELDILHGQTISDYKFVSVWAAKDGPKPEWVEQANLYHLLAVRNGITSVTGLEICAVYRDWAKTEARRDRNYPQRGVQVFQLPIWSFAEAERFLEYRVQLHQEARKELPQCTPAEMWERPDKWAVMKEGRKSALRVLDSESEALLWAIENDHAKHDDKGTYKWGSYTVAFRSGISIVKRPGERVRCASYCAVAGFCEQWSKHQKITT